MFASHLRMQETQLGKRRPREQSKSQPIHHALARQIGSNILAGGLKPGDCVGGEVAQSQALGVSRAAYREAIRMLLAKGLLLTRPKAGTHVAPRRRWNLLDPEVIDWIFSGTPDPQFIRDLLELRALIEPAAAAMAAQRRSPAQLKELETAMAEMTVHGLQSAEGQEADRQFHNSMLTASGNEAFASLSDSIGAAVKWITFYKQQVDPWPRDLIDEHRAVLEGIAAGDPDQARAAMTELLDLTLAHVTPQFAGENKGR